MTLKVWVTQLQTVVFGYGINSEHNPRKIIKMIEFKDDCKNANSLSQLNGLSLQATEFNKNNIDTFILGALDEDNTKKLKE